MKAEVIDGVLTLTNLTLRDEQDVIAWLHNEKPLCISVERILPGQVNSININMKITANES